MPTQNINVSGQAANLVPEFTLIGDWDAVSRALKELPLAMAAGAELGQLAAAKKLQAVVKKNIRQNGPAGIHWPELGIDYQIKKAKHGGNPDRMWFYTGQYYNNIKVMQKGTGVTVGVPKNVRGRVNQNNPLTLGQIANILENGSPSHNIQARPLWGPSFKEFGGKNRIAYHMIWHMRNSIYLMTGLRAKIK